MTENNEMERAELAQAFVSSNGAYCEYLRIDLAKQTCTLIVMKETLKQYSNICKMFCELCYCPLGISQMNLLNQALVMRKYCKLGYLYKTCIRKA